MTAAVTPLRAGDPSQLGAYRLTGLLGEGGQGTVYLAEDETGDRVALKLLHARFSGDPKARSRFAAEVAVAKRVSAFCTARVLDSDVEGDRPYIVSEYIEGPSLSEVLSADGARGGTDLDRLAIGTMTALAAIHQAGVVHRDFKPANVLLPPDGPRVIDFGIARALDATGTMSSTAVGTPAYMAPEQISGARVGPAADVFAWGATMAYAANGRPAFGQDSIPAVMHRILNLPPDLGELHEPLRQIVADCLSKDPALRPASQRVLAHLLDLAGSLPDPDARQGGQDALMLTQGAATAATESARLRTQPPSPPAQAPSHQTPQPQTPQPQTPQPMPMPGMPVPGPPPPGGQAPAPPWSSTVPPAGGQGSATWPSGPSFAPPGTGPGTPAGRSGKPRIGVLASVGGAALVALVLVGTAVAVQLGRSDGDAGTTQGGRTGGTFRMALPSPSTPGEEIDPSHAFSGTARFLVKQLFTGLTEVGPDGGARNRLATRITPDPTCRQWKIEVKEGTTFVDGTPVDAQAFARGWNRSAAEETGGGSYLMTDIQGHSEVADGKAEEMSGVRAVSGTLLTVALTSPNCDFAARLSEPAFMPVPEAAGEPGNESFNTRPVGNGPFKLEEHREDTSISLVRNDTWAFGKAKFDGVELRLTDDAAAGQAAYAAGEVDWAALTADRRAPASQEGLVTRPSPFTRMIVPVTARGPMKSREARQAVSHALDRSKIVQALGGLGKPAHGIVPASVPGFGESGRCPSCDRQDAAKAKQLAEQAGLKPGTEISLYFREMSVYPDLAALVKRDLETALRLRVVLKPTPVGSDQFDDFRKAVVSDDASGLVLFTWGPDYPSPYSMLWPLLGGDLVATADNSYFNYSGWKNGQFDELMSTALRNPQAGTRTNLFKEAEKLALDDLALIPLLNDAHTAIVRKDKYTGLEMDYDGHPTVATAALK
ncbi:ABC transporter substrate-binding protein [Actinomadura sp. 7K507]|uniref:ABC transporter substrate-binding protein n=1 Tax=Actinomadura sp. 7K507 TaxID=2530365 RepID=UPI0010497E41|nr:ABC transporter substrate-binding protein [Actinomadura sp. 7K507]TDC83832.1 hypothetical protein E1285_28000 [Actinomadura sp. 7K507]